MTSAPRIFPSLLANGITFVRDMGGDLHELDALRSAVLSGQLAGPEIIRAGPFVDGPKPNPVNRRVVTSKASAHEAVRTLRSEGVDFVKVHNGVALTSSPPPWKRRCGWAWSGACRTLKWRFTMSWRDRWSSDTPRVMLQIAGQSVGRSDQCSARRYVHSAALSRARFACRDRIASYGRRSARPG